MEWGCAQAGHGYIVGAGAGAADLLTVRAVRLIESADMILLPRAEGAEGSLARAIVEPYLVDQEVAEIVYPMRRDAEATRAVWDGAAGRMAEACGAGRAVVQVTLGDPLLYSTGAYLLEALLGRMPGERVHLVPGISAMQAAAARFHEPLTLQEDRLLLMPATDPGAVEDALGQCETLVLYKVAGRWAALREVLQRHGLLGRTRIVCAAEQGGRERVIPDAACVEDEMTGYMTTVIVHVGRRGWEWRSDA